MTNSPAFPDPETKAEWDRLWEEEFRGGRRGGSISRYTFRAHLYLAEKDLAKSGQLDLFRQTQRLSDYPRAEDAIKRGWATWVHQECRIGPNEAADYLRLNQSLLLYGLRRDQRGKARQKRISCCSKLLAEPEVRSDKDFLRKLRHVKADPGRKLDGYREFIHLLLANWIPAFWWLMPLKSVANDIARTEGKANDTEAVNRYYENLRQITTRKTPPSPGAFFSAGWNGVFYSSHPALIDWVEKDGSPHLSVHGTRLLGNRVPGERPVLSH